MTSFKRNKKILDYQTYFCALELVPHLDINIRKKIFLRKNIFRKNNNEKLSVNIKFEISVKSKIDACK